MNNEKQIFSWAHMTQFMNEWKQTATPKISKQTETCWHKYFQIAHERLSQRGLQTLPENSPAGPESPGYSFNPGTPVCGIILFPPSYIPHTPFQESYCQSLFFAWLSEEEFPF